MKYALEHHRTLVDHIIRIYPELLMPLFSIITSRLCTYRIIYSYSSYELFGHQHRKSHRTHGLESWYSANCAPQ